MLLSLLGSLLAFVISTVWTQNQLLRRQAEVSAQKIGQALQARVRDLTTAAQLLASDPEVLRALEENTEISLITLNRRAVVVRDRFELDLVQIYDVHNLPRTNLLIASLYRETFLLKYVEPGVTAARVVHEQALLLSRADVLNNQGTIVVGLDLENEIKRLLARYRLSAEMGLQFTPSVPSNPAVLMQIATSERFPFEAPDGRSPGIYKHRIRLKLGETPADLFLIHSTADLQAVTMTGIWVMLVSTAVTTALLIVLSTALMRTLVQPIQQISKTAMAVAKGDLNQRIVLSQRALWLDIGRADEIVALVDSFNGMVSDLQDLYMHLEARVTARTHELSVAAELARSVSSSSDVALIMQIAVQLLRRRLGFYRVGLFMINEAGQKAILREVSGEIGEYDKGHVIPLCLDTLVGAAAAIHTVCVIPDAARETRLTHIWVAGAQSALAVPVLFGQDVLGVLEIQQLSTEAFPPEMIRLLNTLADQIALGLHNAQRYADEQKRRRIAEVLELTGRVLAGNLNIEELPGRALAALTALVKFERSSLWMQEGERLKPLAYYGYNTYDNPFRNKNLTVDGDVYQRLKTTQQPLIMADVSAESQWQQRPWLPGERGWMGTPVIARGEVIGMLCLSNRTAGGFTAEDAEWVQAFANQLGVALENANLYAQLLRMNEELLRAQQHPLSGSDHLLHCAASQAVV